MNKIFIFIFLVSLIIGCGKQESKKEDTQNVKKDSLIKTESNKVTESQQKETDEQVKKEIRNKVDKYFAEINSKGSNIKKYYTDEVIYYKIGKMSSDKIVKDKQKAFSKWDNINMTLENINIKKISDNLYEFTYDKNFKMENYEPAKSYTGKTQSKLVFEKINGDWLINEETDGKLYTSDKTGYETKQNSENVETKTEKNQPKEETPSFSFIGSWSGKDNFYRVYKIIIGPSSYYFSYEGINSSGTYKQKGNRLNLTDQYGMDAGYVDKYGSSIKLYLSGTGEFTCSR